MKFNKDPEDVKQRLIAARIDILKKLIDIANKKECNLFVIAGDLFDKITKISKRDINSVVKNLSEFSGECILVLPGNHDYDNGMSELWTTMAKNITDKMILINKNTTYDLSDYDLDIVIYPAHCTSKHSDTNNLSWIKELEEYPEGKYHIGVGHGALQGLSPDMDNRYYNMSQDELKSLDLDMWLLGHTHIPYPDKEKVMNGRIFNAGTPEPDGMDCTHGGNAWIISIDDEKNTQAEKIHTGIYRFYDLSFDIENEDDFEKINKKILFDNPENKLIRVKLSGRIERELFKRRQEYYDKWIHELMYIDIDDSDLGIIISKDVIEKEFTKGSFPYKLLSSLSEEKDNEGALQLAYELIMEVKE